MPDVQLQLHPDGVAAPAQRAAEISKEVVDLYFAALAKEDLSKKPQSADDKFFKFEFAGSKLTAEQRRSIHENWILSRAFQDLIRGIRASLEEAYFFCELLAAGKITAKASSTLESVLQPFRKRANDLNFPDLLKAVNARLETPLEFSDSYQSLQNARNCLEHRNGIVGTVDINADGKMVLQFPRMMMFVEREGKDVELHQGMEVKKGEVVAMKFAIRQREFSLGSPLSLTAADFDEISFGCAHFAVQLASRLPKPEQQGSATA